jgi:hypothetical protein
MLAGEKRCARCGRVREDHSFNGACYGVCGDFVEPAVRTPQAEVERLRAALEDIAYMDDFLNAETAKRMMNIARATLSNGECEA